MERHHLHRQPRAWTSFRPSNPSRALFAGIALLALSACDFTVTNPGPMQDEQLNDPAAHQGLVTGMSQSLSSALWRAAFVTAEVSREYVQGGRIFTTKLPITPGQLTREDIGSQYWNEAVRARWIAEDGVRRFSEILPDFESSPLAAQALTYVGFSNRLLGENFCESVIDGGAPEPGELYFHRAEAAFTQAIQVAERAGAGDLVRTARAGRATVRIHLGDWPGAVADAEAVPESFTFLSPFHGAQLDQFNGVYYSNANEPFRTHSVIGTFYEDYYLETGDPRVAWGRDEAVPTAEFPAVPWYFQLKYQSRGDDIRLVSGRELRLIEAEARLRQGDAGGAVAILNGLRTSLVSDMDGAPLEPWPSPAGAEEAWTYLKRERAAELWLEGRRMADLRRWVEEGVPGAMEDVSDRIRLCLPIAQSEIDTNPNIQSDHPDPVSPAFTGR
jgi:starch-binding outer membrane protein, SusD/RagB family